jgi:hypothetical protein
LEDFLRREATSQLGAAPADARLNAIAHEAWVHTSALNTRMQEDAFNCGVFAMVFADCLSAGFPIHQCPLHADTLVAARAHLADALLEVSTIQQISPALRRHGMWADCVLCRI